MAQIEICRGAMAPPDTAPVEVVERKGLGHPDTICDALAEELSLALGTFYLERFGAILHHNVDKALLWGGASRPAFGGGEVLEPFEVFLAGRAVREHQGIAVPVEELAQQAARAWLAQTFHALDVDRHVRIHAKVRPGSVDLRELFDRQQHVGVPLANDTSCGVGYAPRSRVELAVLAAERGLQAPWVKERLPFIGEDVKVFAVRRGEHLALTVSCAQVDRHLPSRAAYEEGKERLAEVVRAAVQPVWDRPLELSVNAGDDPARGQVFLTVTGTSAEAGDDGAAGRGNRIGGLITPHRAMSIESAAGKNPVTHVGKLYGVLAQRLADRIVAEVPEAAAVTCWLASRIGWPIDDPRLVQVMVWPRGDADIAHLQPAIEAIVRRQVSGADDLWRLLLERAVALY